MCVHVSSVMCVCVCLPFDAVVVTSASAAAAAAAHSLLGNTRPQHSAISSSGIGWRWTVGGDAVTIYNLGSRVLALRCKSAHCGQLEEMLLDVHVRCCCTADRLSLTDCVCCSATDSVGSVREALQLSEYGI